MVSEKRSYINSMYQQITNVPFVKARFPDSQYILPTVRQVRDHMENFPVKPYKPELADCDNRALLLLTHFSGLGYAFAWASIGIHDICTFMSDQRQIWYIEPSNCLIYPPDVNLTWIVMP